MYDFQVATSETDTSSALRCQFERTDLGQFTYFCHVGDGNGPIICPTINNPETIHPAMDIITREWGNNRAVEDGHRVYQSVGRRSM